MALEKGISVTRRMAELHLKHKRSILVDYTINPNHAGGEVSALIELNSLEHAQRINQEEILSGARATTQELVRGLAHEIKNPLVAFAAQRSCWPAKSLTASCMITRK